MSVIDACASVGYHITIRKDGEAVAEIEQVADGWALRMVPDDRILFCDSPVDAVREFYAYAHER